jgi:MFS family permease
MANTMGKVGQNIICVRFDHSGFCVNWLQSALIAPFQVVSRVMDIFLARRITPILLGAISIMLMVCGFFFLLLAAVSSYTVLLFAIFFGLGQGLTYIVQGSIPLYLFGHSHYGAITGRINGIRIITTAIAPVSVAMLIDNTAIEAVILLLSICMAGSLWLLVYLRNQQNLTIIQPNDDSSLKRP